MERANQNQKMGIVLKEKAKAKAKARAKANHSLSSRKKEKGMEKANPRVKRVNPNLLKGKHSLEGPHLVSQIPVCNPRHPLATPRSHVISAI